MTNSEAATERPQRDPFDAIGFKRPDPALLTYYTLFSAMTLIGFPFVWVPHYFRYVTLRYQFDAEGVSVAWGIFFKKEVLLTYRRIQDIHVRRTLFQRWLGIATVAVQTASGSSGAEMTIEGVRDPEGLRDYLYARMRGAQTDESDPVETTGQPDDEALLLLREIRDLLAADQQQAGSP